MQDHRYLTFPICHTVPMSQGVCSSSNWAHDWHSVCQLDSMLVGLWPRPQSSIRRQQLCLLTLRSGAWGLSLEVLPQIP